MKLTGRPKRALALRGPVDRDQFGPAMSKLSEQQQNFIIAYWSSDTQHEAARIAGYKSDNLNALKVQASRLLHSPKIRAALQEFAGNILMAEGVKTAVNRLLELMHSDNEKVALDAVKTFLDRNGMVAATQHNVNVEVTLTREEKVAKLREFAAQTGMDTAKVLGNVIDLEPEDYEEAEDDA